MSRFPLTDLILCKIYAWQERYANFRMQWRAAGVYKEWKMKGENMGTRQKRQTVN